jgi:hypothetical protein
MTPNDAKARTAATYNAAADSYDDFANSFWDRFGRRTIEQLRPHAGARILDPTLLDISQQHPLL